MRRVGPTPLILVAVVATLAVPEPAPAGTCEPPRVTAGREYTDNVFHLTAVRFIDPCGMPETVDGEVIVRRTDLETGDVVQGVGILAGVECNRFGVCEAAGIGIQHREPERARYDVQLFMGWDDRTAFAERQFICRTDARFTGCQPRP